MSKKRLFLLASLPLSIIATFSVLAMLPARTSITKANFDRIKNGMTRLEVEEILGRQDAYSEWKSFGTFTTSSGFNHYCYWHREDGAQALIQFHDKSVVRKTWSDSTETIIQKLRRLLQLQ